MELRHLRYFIAVAEHGHFGRAAEALHTAQPSLSQQIRQLESEVGVALFERTTRHVRLTPAGEMFLAESRQLLAQLSVSIEGARAVASGERGHLRVSFVSGAMGAGALSHLFHDFQASHPDVSLDARPMPALAQIEALHDETIHIGFFSAGYRDDGFAQLFVWRERLVLAMPQHHPFAGRAAVQLADLQQQRLMMYSRGSGSQLQNAIIAVLHEERIDPEIVHEGGDAETIIGLVAAGRGVSLVPQSWSAFQFPGVTYRPVEPARWIEPGMAMFWNPSDSSPLVAEFVASVRRTLTTNPEIKSLQVSISQ
jgi:DNA-binding transcriptional LysR family regulator